MANDEPPFLVVGTEVSAKYKGAFCEAKVKKVCRMVKCRVSFKNLMGGSVIVTDDNIKGNIRVGAVVEAKHPDKPSVFQEATINKVIDQSQYTVVFDDGDITTLRRTSLCLKSGKHYSESESLDQLPLTNPEHFSAPVATSSSSSSSIASSGTNDRSAPKSNQRKKRTAAALGEFLCREGDSSGDEEEETPTARQPPKKKPTTPKTPASPAPSIAASASSVSSVSGIAKTNFTVGSVVLYEAEKSNDKSSLSSQDKQGSASGSSSMTTPRSKKEASMWTPALVIKKDSGRKDEVKLKLFRDGAIVTVPKKELQEFDRKQSMKGHPQKSAIFKALVYLEKGDLPSGWNKKELLGNDETRKSPDTGAGGDTDSDVEDQDDVAGEDGDDDDDDVDGDDESESDQSNGEERDRFVAQLYKFMDERGTPINKAPVLNGKDLDLYELFMSVAKIGSFDKVTNLNKWRDIYGKTQREAKASHAQGQQLKLSYKKYLLSFEDLYRKLGMGTLESKTSGTGHRSQRIMTRNKQTSSVAASLFKAREKKAGTPQPDSPSGSTKSGAGSSKEKDKEKEAVEDNKEKDEKRPGRKKNEDSGKDSQSGSSTPKRARSDSLDQAAVKKAKAEKAAAVLASAQKNKERKKKNKSDSDKESNSGEESDDAPPVRRSIEPILVGHRIKVKYGHGKQHKVYEAKVLKIEDSEEEAGEKKFFVHYTGWNNRYDEWILKKRILENITGKLEKNSKSSAGGSAKKNSSALDRSEKDSLPCDKPPADKKEDSEEPRKRRGKPPKKFAEEGFEVSLPSKKDSRDEKVKDKDDPKEKAKKDDIKIKEEKKEQSAAPVASSSTETPPKKVLELSPEQGVRIFAVKSKPPEVSSVKVPPSSSTGQTAQTQNKSTVEKAEVTAKKEKKMDTPTTKEEKDDKPSTPKRRILKKKKANTPTLGEERASTVVVAPVVTPVKQEVQSEGEDTDIEKDPIIPPMISSNDEEKSESVKSDKKQETEPQPAKAPEVVEVAKTRQDEEILDNQEPEEASTEVEEAHLDDSLVENTSLNLDESGVEALDTTKSEPSGTPVVSAVSSVRPTDTSTPTMADTTPIGKVTKGVVTAVVEETEKSRAPEVITASPITTKTRKPRGRRVSESKEEVAAVEVVANTVEKEKEKPAVVTAKDAARPKECAAKVAVTVVVAPDAEEVKKLKRLRDTDTEVVASTTPSSVVAENAAPECIPVVSKPVSVTSVIVMGSTNVTSGAAPAKKRARKVSECSSSSKSADVIPAETKADKTVSVLQSPLPERPVEPIKQEVVVEPLAKKTQVSAVPVIVSEISQDSQEEKKRVDATANKGKKTTELGSGRRDLTRQDWPQTSQAQIQSQSSRSGSMSPQNSCNISSPGGTSSPAPATGGPDESMMYVSKKRRMQQRLLMQAAASQSSPSHSSQGDEKEIPQKKSKPEKSEIKSESEIKTEFKEEMQDLQDDDEGTNSDSSSDRPMQIVEDCEDVKPDVSTPGPSSHMAGSSHMMASNASNSDALATLADICGQKEQEQNPQALFLMCEEHVLPASPLPNNNNDNNEIGNGPAHEMGGAGVVGGIGAANADLSSVCVMEVTPPTTPDDSQSSGSNQARPQPPHQQNRPSNPSSGPAPADEESTMSADSSDSNRNANVENEKVSINHGRGSSGKDKRDNERGGRGHRDRDREDRSLTMSGRVSKRTRKTLRHKASRMRCGGVAGTSGGLGGGGLERHASPSDHKAPHHGLLSAQMINYDPTRPSRFNFNLPLDDITDPEERISLIQDRLCELKKTYLSLKAEVAMIDRRKKKARRREASRGDGSTTNSPRHMTSPHRGGADD